MFRFLGLPVPPSSPPAELQNDINISTAEAAIGAVSAGIPSNMASPSGRLAGLDFSNMSALSQSAANHSSGVNEATMVTTTKLARASAHGAVSMGHMSAVSGKLSARPLLANDTSAVPGALVAV